MTDYESRKEAGCEWLAAATVVMGLIVLAIALIMAAGKAIP